jgi:hypothetical protein
VSGLDGLSLLQCNAQDLMDPEDRNSPIFAQKGFGGENPAYLPSHGIFDRGRLVGLWEFDTATESIAWASFIPKNRDLAKAVTDTGTFVRSQLGDARSFSLDSPKSRVPRVEALRAVSGR